MLPKFKPSFIGFSLQSVIHIRIDSNTSISKRSNTHVNKRIVGINAFHLKTCFAFSSSSVSHTPPPDSPTSPFPLPPRPPPSVPPAPPCLQKNSGVPPLQKLLLHGGGWPWLPLDALQQCYFTLLKSSALLWQRCFQDLNLGVCV